MGPRACYDEGKRAAETLFMDYHRANRVNIRIVRIFNTYGPRMHPFDGRVVSNFIRQALRGEDITDLRRRLANPLLLLSRRPGRGADSHHGRARRSAGSGQPGQSGGIHDCRAGRVWCWSLTGCAAKLVYEPLPADDPAQRRPDIMLATTRLGWRPTVPLREGLKRTIAWFRSIDMSHYRPPTPNY